MLNDYKVLFENRGFINGDCFVKHYGESVHVEAEEEMCLGFDPSTKSTGLALVGFESREVYGIFDLMNKGLPTEYMYMEMIENTVRELIAGLNIKFMVTEKPWGLNQNKNAFKALTRMKDKLEDMRYKMGELRHIPMHEIYPQSWKKGFLYGDRYKGRFGRNEVKGAIRDECVERYPELRPFLIYAASTSDSFDALGLTCGYLDINYEEGYRKVNRGMNIKYTHKISSRIIKTNEARLDEDVIDPNEDWLNFRGFEVIRFNNDLTLEENIRRYTSNTNKCAVAFLSLEDKLTAPLMLERGEFLEEGEFYVVIGWRDNLSASVEAREGQV